LDQARPQAQRSTRGLALIVAGLVLAGVVSAVILVADDDRPGSAIVSAAGGQSGTVDVTSTVTVPLPVQPSTPPPTGVTTTTLPKAAVDVLNAIAGSTTTTRRPATTTTTIGPPAAPTTTTVPAPTTTSTTAPPAPFTATLVNEHTQAVVVNVNGRNFPLTPAQTLDVELPISLRGDLVQVRLAADEKCGVSDSGVIFKPGGSYRVGIVESDTLCKDSAGHIPLLRIGPR
jgi:hypothetical protein